ncbi:MAG TPA: excinuclease ABC subunit UvrA [bacterium]|nr:excinuclease ABC subunit UvrA [bacterium]HPT29384.1 excinuclease ABC subunit UvrA [bacterium]
MADNFIRLRGVKVNNLKNIDIDIPRDKFVVITGLSGSGKSSLAFDTLYAEGQRRYVESLSAYARQFVGLLAKPEVEMIEGLPPAIAINQHTLSNNPRSTVGTITEIYDYLRLLFSKIGQPHCPECQAILKKEEKKLVCPNGHIAIAELKPGDFSFNSLSGACPACSGLGTKLEVDPDLLLNNNLSLAQGGVKPWTHYSFTNQKVLLDQLTAVAPKHGFDINTPLKDLNKNQISWLLNGGRDFDGVIANLKSRYSESDSHYIHQKIAQYMQTLPCPVCLGKRLKPEILAVTISDLNIYELGEKNIDSAYTFFATLAGKSKLPAKSKLIVESIAKEIMSRLELIKNVGLNYLNLNRPATTLSGGEAQRLRLATQIGSGLVGVMYVLDEPSIGLHQRDNAKLISTLKTLKDRGNSVIVVEHDEATILAADYLLDVGPGAGTLGGEIIFAGTPQEIKKDKKSLTGQYLSGQLQIQSPVDYRSGNGKVLKIWGAKEHNLRNIDVEIPLGKIVAITGVSGSGKSTLITDILAKALNQKFYRSKDKPGEYEKLTGLENINKVIDIDQSPIGRTPRSNPATYTEVFTPIRELYASLPEAKAKGFRANHFSFNTVGGRCENCSGDGVIKIEMQFLNDIYMTCEVCGGARYKKEILNIRYRDKNISEVLDLTVSEALKFFQEEKNITNKLKTLEEVGLGYIKLGQSSTTLSGGEAQRIKLATELSRPATGHTLYLLDEPTTGLHFADIDRLLKVLHRLVDKGHTVLIIEHNLDVIKSVDWIIDLGPEGGDQGGQIVACGTPRQVAQNKNSWTGKYLKSVL